MRNKLTLKKNREEYRKKQLHLKELRRKNKFQTFNNVKKKEQYYQINQDEILIEVLKDNAFKPFGHWITPKSGQIIIEIPKNFCFCSNYEECLQIIKLFASSMYDYLGNRITLDFSKCMKVDTSALFMLQVMRLEISGRLMFVQTRLNILNIIPEIIIVAPKGKDAVRLLLNLGFPISEESIKNLNDDSTLVPIGNMGYLKGSKSQRHYLENKKSVYTADVVKYLNSCLKLHGYELTDLATNNIDGIIGEVLNNAEDHSGTNDWYVTANFSKELLHSDSEDVGEMNLTIINFGNSIYEAFQNTSQENIGMFNQVNDYAKDMIANHADLKFSEEQLFVLATMQEQISRLKFERESRGTGTMKFINSFLDLGDFEDDKKNYTPNLSIFSGNVHLICDNTYKPFLKDKLYCLSLNSEKNLRIPPKSSHLKGLKQKFPGTLLSVKIYINKNHWDTKYGGDNHEQN